MLKSGQEKNPDTSFACDGLTRIVCVCEKTFERSYEMLKSEQEKNLYTINEFCPHKQKPV